MDSEWKCPQEHPIEMVNEGYGVCYNKSRDRWFVYSFNGDAEPVRVPYSVEAYRDYPLPGMTTHDIGGFGEREEAIEFIRSRRPQSTLVALPTQEELALR